MAARVVGCTGPIGSIDNTIAPVRAVYIDRVIALLEATKTQAADAFKRGLKPDEAIKAVDLSAFRKQFVEDNPERAFVFDQGYKPAGVVRAYREAKDGPLHDED
jgi:hypothetical protein